MGVLGRSLTYWRVRLFLSQPRPACLELKWGHRWNNPWEALGAYKHAQTSGVVSITSQSDELGPSKLVLVKTHAQQSHPLIQACSKRLKNTEVMKSDATTHQLEDLGQLLEPQFLYL